jgi:hypothetical protein
MTEDKQIYIDRETNRLLQAISEQLFGQHEPPSRIIRAIVESAASENDTPEDLAEALATSLESTEELSSSEWGSSNFSGFDGFAFAPDEEDDDEDEDAIREKQQQLLRGARR